MNEENCNQFVENLKVERLVKEDGKMPESTWCCHLNEYNLPMADFVISPKKCQNWEEVSDFIERHIADYPFVKTCQFSPKDCASPPVFKTTTEAIAALKQSTRCHLDRHIIMKKVRNYSTQSRIYWAGGKARVACGNMEHKYVEEFLQKHKYDIPFHYCCVELGRESTTTELIEFNTFGTLCDPAPLEWSQDWHNIFYAKDIVWCDV